MLIAGQQSITLDLPLAAAISVVSLGELRAGVLRAGSPELRQVREAQLAAVRSSFEAIPVEEPVALRYGELLAQARDAGRSEKATDLLIAATAAVTGRTLVTLDRALVRLAEAAEIPVRDPSVSAP